METSWREPTSEGLPDEHTLLLRDGNHVSVGRSTFAAPIARQPQGRLTRRARRPGQALRCGPAKGRGTCRTPRPTAVRNRFLAFEGLPFRVQAERTTGEPVRALTNVRRAQPLGRRAARSGASPRKATPNRNAWRIRRRARTRSPGSRVAADTGPHARSREDCERLSHRSRGARLGRSARASLCVSSRLLSSGRSEASTQCAEAMEDRPERAAGHSHSFVRRCRISRECAGVRSVARDDLGGRGWGAGTVGSGRCLGQPSGKVAALGVGGRLDDAQARRSAPRDARIRQRNQACRTRLLVARSQVRAKPRSCL
jgi:hypothetical protein